jgi:hypothetical protein
MLAVLFAGCGNKNGTTTTTTNTEDLPATINLIGITEKTTTQEAIDYVEAALNKLAKTRYKTKIELTLVTADEYIAEIEKRVAEADHAVVKVKAITKYNALAQKEANKAQKLLSESTGKQNNKWTSQVTTVIASTMSTGEVYTAEMTTVYEDGKIETVYPDAQSPIDIIMIDGKEMYDYLNEKGYLLSVEKKLDEKFTKFKQYIYPTFFDQLKAAERPSLMYYITDTTKINSSLIFTNAKELATAKGAGGFSQAIKYGCGLMACTPLIVLYLFCQRYLVQGIERSGIVG